MTDNAFAPVLDINQPLDEQVRVSQSISKYVTLVYKGSFYPILRVNTPASRFSKARFLQTKSPLAKNFNPTLVYDTSILGDVQWQVWDNTLHIPANFSQSRYLA